MLDKCTGIIVLKDKKILLGLRRDGQGWSLPGGKMEENESAYDCAARELEEEFGLKALNLDLLGQVEAKALVEGIERTVKPHIFLCKQFTGEIKIEENEMTEYKWVECEEVKDIDDLFPPSERALMTFITELL